MTVGKSKNVLKYNPTVDKMYAPTVVCSFNSILMGRDRKLLSLLIHWLQEKPMLQLDMLR